MESRRVRIRSRSPVKWKFLLMTIMVLVSLTACRKTTTDTVSTTQATETEYKKPEIQVQDGKVLQELEAVTGSDLMDFKELQEMNPDIIGWIQIPGTAIDYPIVQAEDNDAYMDIGADGEPSAGGTIFLDYESQKDFRGLHNVIYGHNMRNGSMFHDLVRFKEESYFKEHQYGILYTPAETFYLKMVSAYYAAANPLYRTTKFETEAAFEDFFQTMLKTCKYGETDTQVPESLFTFITCSYEFSDARTLVHAVEVSKEEAEAALNRPAAEKGK